MEYLKKAVKKCKKCNLCKTRINPVFGEGNEKTNILLIGEAPGKNEDLLKRPFVGRSGKLLTTVLKSIGIDRKKLYITNIVKCRPPENRNPTEIEQNVCANNYLFKQIDFIKPKLIVLLGAVAAKFFFGNSFKMLSERGQVIRKSKYRIMAAFHPAYVLRFPSNEDIFVKDLKKMKGILKNGK